MYCCEVSKCCEVSIYDVRGERGGDIKKVEKKKSVIIVLILLDFFSFSIRFVNNNKMLLSQIF